MGEWSEFKNWILEDALFRDYSRIKEEKVMLVLIVIFTISIIFELIGNISAYSNFEKTSATIEDIKFGYVAVSFLENISYTTRNWDWDWNYNPVSNKYYYNDNFSDYYITENEIENNTGKIWVGFPDYFFLKKGDEISILHNKRHIFLEYHVNYMDQFKQVIMYSSIFHLFLIPILELIIAFLLLVYRKYLKVIFYLYIIFATIMLLIGLSS